MGTIKDPENGTAVATSIFVAVAVYAVSTIPGPTVIHVEHY